MRYPSWTGLSDRVVLCLHLALGYIVNMAEDDELFRFHKTIAMSHHTKPLPVIAMRLLIPLVFAFLLRMPVWFIFSTRLPNVGLAWWDYHQVTSSFGYRDLSLTDKVQTEKETKQRTYVFRLMSLYTLIWVIVMGIMFWIEADERESYRTGSLPRYREGLLAFSVLIVLNVLKLTRACYGTFYRFHNRIRCELEAERPWLGECTRQQSAEPLYPAHREIHFQLFAIAAVIVCCVGVVFRSCPCSRAAFLCRAGGIFCFISQPTGLLLEPDAT